MSKNFLKFIIILFGIFVLLSVYLLITNYITKRSQKSVSSPQMVMANLVILPTFSAAEQAIYYYDPPSQTIKKYSLKNQMASEISGKIPQPVKIYWSDDRKNAILNIINNKSASKMNPSFSNNREVNTPTLWAYNLAEQKPILLGENIDDPAQIMPGRKILYVTNDKILYNYRDYQGQNQINNFSISQLDGSNWQKLTDISEDVAEILYYDNAQTVVYATYEVTKNSAIIKYNWTQKNKETLADNYSWLAASPDGKQILLEILNGSKREYYILDTQSGARKKLSTHNYTLDQTSVGWGQDNQDIFAAAYDNNNRRTNLLHMVIKSGSTTTLDFAGQENYDITGIMPDSNNKILYFISTNKLYKLSY